MSNLEKLKVNNPTVYRVLKNSYLKKKIAHAYIFSGEQNTEILYAAELLIEILISEQNLFTGHQPRDWHSYPDLYILDGHTSLIDKDSVKNALEKLQLTPLDSQGVKILYIKNIENANKQSLNALLKFIENPQNRTYIIMTTHHIHNVLPTIKSRAIEIKVRPISKQVLTKELIKANIDKTIAQVLATFTNSLHEAMGIMKEQKFSLLYEKIMNVLTLVYNNVGHLVASLSQLITKQNHHIVLAIILTFIRDIIKIKDNLAIDNEKYTFLVEKYAHTSFNYYQAFQLINQFLVMQKYHVNFNLAKNNLLLQLERCYE